MLDYYTHIPTCMRMHVYAGFCTCVHKVSGPIANCIIMMSGQSLCSGWLYDMDMHIYNFMVCDVSYLPPTVGDQIV